MPVIVSKQMVLPKTDKLLSDYAEGDIVYLNVNGSPYSFYVAKHNYESDLNGAGRTLLVQEDCLTKGDWNTESENAYADSTVDTWLNGTYKARLDSDVQNAIGTTTFYYTPGDFTYSVSTLSRSIFLLSLTELGISATYGNIEGSMLPISTTLQNPYIADVLQTQWTRTPYKNGNTYAFAVKGTHAGNYNTYEDLYYRPCFTLSGDTKFDSETNELKKVV